jgi:hypothetical protein
MGSLVLISWSERFKTRLTIKLSKALILMCKVLLDFYCDLVMS